MKKVFIHTNNKQGIGAILSKFSIERFLSDKEISVEYINVDQLPVFKNFVGKKYLRNGKEMVYNPNDLQSFTLSRFMPPELMNYSGRAVVIDPDIFSIKDISSLFTLDLKGSPIAACSKKGAWDTSMMVLDCDKLKHWNMAHILSDLENKKLDYSDIMSLRTEKSILEMPRIWNNLDTLTDDTYLIHTTNRLTQPWKTGLKIDFTPNDPGKLFGIIPKKLLLQIRGKWPTHYQKHPDPTVEKFFFDLTKQALAAGAITKQDIQKAIDSKDVRPDLLALCGNN
jgi:hypothetical protein